MTIKVTNPYVEKIAAISIPLSKVIETLMEDEGMTCDEAAEHIEFALFKLDVEYISKGKKTVNQVREKLGFEDLERTGIVTDAYLEGIMNRKANFTW